jgi:hypothetical protein
MRHQEWVSFQCACGFRIQRLPRPVVDELPRCLGCGRDLRRPAEGLRTQALGDVRDLR